MKLFVEVFKDGKWERVVCGREWQLLQEKNHMELCHYGQDMIDQKQQEMNENSFICNMPNALTNKITCFEDYKSDSEYSDLYKTFGVHIKICSLESLEKSLDEIMIRASVNSEKSISETMQSLFESNHLKVKKCMDLCTSIEENAFLQGYLIAVINICHPINTFDPKEIRLIVVY